MVGMKHVRSIGGVLAWGVVLAVGSTAWGQSIFEDERLEDAVRQQVHEKRNTDEPLTAEDVQDVATIDASGREIESLAGMEHCRSLASLNLSDNAVEDLSPLAGLTELQTLNLAENAVSDVSPLAKLAELQHLDLSGNSVEDVSPLAKLTNVRSLYLSENAVADISPLGAMEHMWSLHLDGNPVEDWQALEKLEDLDTLDVSRTGLSDASAVTPALSQLRLLIMDGNDLSDVSPLVGAIEADAEGDQQFAPFLRLYLRENPLSDSAKQQLEGLAESAGTQANF